jgi:hypothetical protein
MRKIEDWAEYYFNKGINVIPDSEHFDWADWSHKKQTIEELQSYDWHSAKEIYAVVGKKGLRVLSLLGADNESIEYRDLLVERSLSLLKLPYDYPWIVDFGDAISIFVESADDIRGMKSQKYADMELLWQDTLTLPSNGSIHFYYSQLPNDRPTHVQNNDIFRCMDILREDRSGRTDWPYFCGQINPAKLPVLDEFKHLSIASKYNDTNKLLLGIWYLSCDTGLYRIQFKDNGDITERTGIQWRSIVNGKWSFVKEMTKKGMNKYYLHVKGGISKTFDIVYIDENIIYAHQIHNNTKSFFVRDASVDIFRNNDNIVSYLSQIENRSRISQVEVKGNVLEKKSGCFPLLGGLILILIFLLV